MCEVLWKVYDESWVFIEVWLRYKCRVLLKKKKKSKKIAVYGDGTGGSGGFDPAGTRLYPPGPTVFLKKKFEFFFFTIYVHFVILIFGKKNIS